MRRNYYLVHRKKENKGEDTDKLVLQTFINEMKIDIKLEQADQSYKIDSLKKDCDNKKSRPITVKFIRYANRRNIFSDKKRLKSKTISNTESLTKKRLIKLKEAKEQYGFK